MLEWCMQFMNQICEQIWDFSDFWNKCLFGEKHACVEQAKNNNTVSCCFMYILIPN